MTKINVVEEIKDDKIGRELYTGTATLQLVDTHTITETQDG